MDIKELNERIEQLTNLVKTSEETISQLKETLKSVEQERDKLADERRKLEPEFEIAQDEKYYFIDFYFKGCNLDVRSAFYTNVLVDKTRFTQNNCFKTEERTKEVIDKINLLLRLERFHDIYCPDYKPDWKANTMKYSVAYGASEAKWHPYNALSVKNAVTVYFPTEGIAQKVCDILNKEREEHDNS